jgi:hypothetical protein
VTHVDGEEAEGAVELGHLDDVREQEDEAAHTEQLHKQHLVRVCKTHKHLIKRVCAVCAVCAMCGVWCCAYGKICGVRSRGR